MLNELKDFGEGYPTRAVVEVSVLEEPTLMIEEEVRLFRGFTEFERIKYLKRILEAKKRAADVATLDGRYLKWFEYRNEKQKGDEK